MLHDQSAEHTAFAAWLPGQHELDRESTFGSSPADQASMPMAGQADGKALGGIIRLLSETGTRSTGPPRACGRRLGAEACFATAFDTQTPLLKIS